MCSICVLSRAHARGASSRTRTRRAHPNPTCAHRYFLTDGTLAVYEESGGKFLDRGRHRNAAAAAASGACGGAEACCVPAGDGFRVRRARAGAPPPPYFTAGDLRVGCTVEFAHAPGQRFTLTAADAFTEKCVPRARARMRAR